MNVAKVKKKIRIGIKINNILTQNNKKHFTHARIMSVYNKLHEKKVHAQEVIKTRA